MSKVEITKITDRTGSGAPNFTNGFNIAGADSGISGFTHTEGSSEPSSPSNGDTWWDSGNDIYKVYMNNAWQDFLGTSAPAVSGYNGARGFWYGGATTNYASRTNIIDYVTIANTGNATDFGDLTESMGLNSQGASNGVRGVRMGGRKPDNNESDTMDYITCATPGNATDFGNLSSARRETTGASNGTRGLAIGGRDSSATNIIEYITIANTGNATDFGDCLTTKQGATGVNGETRALVVGTTTDSNTIEYIVVATTGNSVDFGDLAANHNKGGSAADSSRAVIALGRDSGSGDTNRLNYVANDTAGNATDFGDLTVGRLENTSGCSDGTKGVFGGGLIYSGSTASNVIDYVTIQTAGNAQDFGDLTSARFEQGSFGGNAA